MKGNPMNKIILSAIALFLLIGGIGLAQPTRRSGSSPIERGSALIYNSDGSIYIAPNVGIGTASPVAGLQVGVGSSSLSATLGTTSALVKGNLEVDGKIYTKDLNVAEDITASGNIYGYGSIITTIGPDEVIYSNSYPATMVDFNVYTASVSVTPNFVVEGAVYIGQKTFTSSALYIKQTDGGCSKCGVDAAGTTWSCVDITCSIGGM